MELAQRKISRRGLIGTAGAMTAAAALGGWTQLAGADGVCPPTVPGSVLGQTGTVNGTAPASVDAMFDVDPPVFQRQCYSILSNFQGVADRYRQNQVKANEIWLLINQIAAVPDHSQSATFSTGTYTVGTTSNDPDGTLRGVAATFTIYNKSCGYTQKTASSGTVTFTVVTDDLVQASYDLVFNKSDRVRGSYSAPRCVLCGPRPARTCLK